MKKNSTHRFKTMAVAMLALGSAFVIAPTARAADHGDSPVPSNNQEVDIADVFFFLDPNDNDQVVLIATIRGFIAAGENSNFGIFDPNVQYHFEIETTGAPDTKPDKFIDVRFSPRMAIPGPAGKEVLQVPQAQTATVTLTGFKDTTGARIKAFGNLPTTPSSTAATALPQVISDVGDTGIKFSAGMVDDPFFFDIPAFAAFIASVRNGTSSAGIFDRGRDSFAGYNVMSIALRMPATSIRGASGTKVGVAFYARKQIVQTIDGKGAVKGKGVFKTFDRMANPAVNVALIPFNRKNQYNQSTPKDDAAFKFAGDILATLKALGTMGTDTTPLSGNAAALAGVAVVKGDYLRLETDKAVAPNTGTGGGGPTATDTAYGNGFPNGRRLRDDTVDILLTLIANGNPFTNPPTGPLGDNVNASDPLPQDVFPFLALPNQPFPSGTTDDKTRN